MSALARDGLSLEFLKQVWREDEEAVLCAVKQNGMALRFASKKLLEDVQIVRKALESDERALKYVSSKEVVCEVVGEKPMSLKHAHWEALALV